MEGFVCKAEPGGVAEEGGEAQLGWEEGGRFGLEGRRSEERCNDRPKRGQQGRKKVEQGGEEGPEMIGDERGLVMGELG